MSGRFPSARRERRQSPGYRRPARPAARARLSGGQRQRVALGRAIVREPAAFLMDEPLSNLDAKLRIEMRAYLARLHQELGTTTLYVTHDQTEAMTMGDRVAVMHDGRLEQAASPQELYDEPANIFVAGFMGSPAMNLVRGKLTNGAGRVELVLGSHRLRVPDTVLAHNSSLAGRVGEEIVAGIRPEALELAGTTNGNGAASLELPVTLTEALARTCSCTRRSTPRRPRHWTTSTSSSARPRHSMLTARLSPQSGVRPGQPVRLSVEMERVHFFDPDSGVALR